MCADERMRTGNACRAEANTQPNIEDKSDMWKEKEESRRGKEGDIKVLLCCGAAEVWHQNEEDEEQEDVGERRMRMLGKGRQQRRNKKGGEERRTGHEKEREGKVAECKREREDDDGVRARGGVGSARGGVLGGSLSRKGDLGVSLLVLVERLLDLQSGSRINPVVEDLEVGETGESLQ